MQLERGAQCTVLLGRMYWIADPSLCVYCAFGGLCVWAFPRPYGLFTPELQCPSRDGWEMAYLTGVSQEREAQRAEAALLQASQSRRAEAEADETRATATLRKVGTSRLC